MFLCDSQLLFPHLPIINLVYVPLFLPIIFCANFKLCKKEDCKTCFDKSFATSDKAIFWSSKNNVKPSNVFIKTPSKYYFNCNIDFSKKILKIAPTFYYQYSLAC